MISNEFKSPEEIAKAPLPYTVISSQPLEVYSIKKTAIYSYLNDEAKKMFLNYIKQIPQDQILRRFYIEKTHWKEF